MTTTAVIVLFAAALIQGGILALCLIRREALEKGLLHIVGLFMGNDVQSLVSLEAPVAESIFRTTTGDLVTFLRVHGQRRLVGPSEFDKLALQLETKLQTLLADGSGRQHRVSVAFLSDPTGTRRTLEDAFAPSVATARRMGAGDAAVTWFRRRVEHLSRACVDEFGVLAVFTMRSGLTAEESARATAELSALWTKAGPAAARAASAAFSQPATAVPSLLMTRHVAAVNSLVFGLEDSEVGIGVLVDRLTNVDALPALARFIHGRDVPRSWRPALLGGRTMGATAGSRDTDLADRLPPPIARQLITERTSEHFDNFEYSVRESTTFVSVKLDVCPTEIPTQAFNTLVRRMGLSEAMPYSVTFEVLPNGTSYRKLDGNLAKFLGGMGDYNKALKAGWDELAKLENYTAAVRGVFTTWSSESKEQAFERVAHLKASVQNWGGATVSNESGSPGALSLASAPGLTTRAPIPFIPAPLDTVSRMLPLFRPASPWRAGELLLCSEDGKPFPIGFGTTLQAFSGGIIMAPTGRGKSFLLNSLNTGLAFSAGLSELPYIVIIDVGMSSSYLIELLHGLLPESKRHQAVFLRLRNDARFAVNPFDTQLGFDRPTERERDFQRYLTGAVSPNLGAEAGRFIGMVIDAAYAKFGRGQPDSKQWQRASNTAMSGLMDRLGIVHEGRRVWDLVDELFDRGHIHEATVVQRYAVPTLFDLISAARSQAVVNNYGKTRSATDEPIIDVFTRNITSAVREYALLSTVTQYDIGDARIVAVDLEELVSGSPDEESKRRAAVMMMFARQIAARNFFLRWDELEHSCPPRYREFQHDRIQRIWTTAKYVIYDEFHVASGFTELIDLVNSDYRTGRKYQVYPYLISQLFHDFSEDIIKNASTYFILGAGNESEGRDIQKAFNLTDAERNCIMNQCLGPNEKGAPMFAMFKTTKGLVSQFLYNSAGPLEVWAYNSSAIDVAVKRAVAKELGTWEALLALADQYPEGTVRRVVEAMRLKMSSEEQVDSGGITATVSRQIVAAARQAAFKKAA